MFCSISGQVPKEPVVSIRTGHLFERALAEKYIDTEGKCPATGGDLAKEDLVAVLTNKAVTPRASATTSIPGLLAHFQNEWDAVMLETFELKKSLHQTRQELSQARAAPGGDVVGGAGRGGAE